MKKGKYSFPRTWYVPQFHIFYLKLRYVLGDFAYRAYGVGFALCKTASETKKGIYTGKNINMVEHTTSLVSCCCGCVLNCTVLSSPI